MIFIFAKYEPLYIGYSRSSGSYIIQQYRYPDLGLLLLTYLLCGNSKGRWRYSSTYRVCL